MWFCEYETTKNHIVSRNFRNEFLNSLYDFLKSRKEFFAKAMLLERQTISFSFFQVRMVRIVRIKYKVLRVPVRAGTRGMLENIRTMCTIRT